MYTLEAPRLDPEPYSSLSLDVRKIECEVMLMSRLPKLALAYVPQRSCENDLNALLLFLLSLHSHLFCERDFTKCLPAAAPTATSTSTSIAVSATAKANFGQCQDIKPRS